MFVESSAPSNIALIKYMGKADVGFNKPTNSSLSWTLSHLRTYVRLTPISEGQHRWEPLQRDGLYSIELSQKSQQRFLNHFEYLKQEFGIQGNYLIQSGSNFPSDCGIASSASSFAALTKVSHELAQRQNDFALTRAELAMFSQRGSGSSCRSFFKPWVLWFSEGVRPLEFPIENLLHQAIIVSEEKKRVSSSDAHQLVATSDLFMGRPERAERRLSHLIEALRSSDWERCFEITWAEFWDMHLLFETSRPGFGYLAPGSVEVLRNIQDLWYTQKDGPIVTMDAGANVHLLYRPDQRNLLDTVQKEFESRFKIFST